LKAIFRISLIFFALALTGFGCERAYQFRDGRISGIDTIQELDKAAVFNFAIMSDNKGDSPQSSRPFARMVKWIKESNSQFVIGLGDHVKKGWENSFLSFLRENRWWHKNFYPNVADGENEFWGKSQGDWGAGAPILDVVDLSKRPNVTIREDGCEYYAKIKARGYTIHLIQLHYPDQPSNDSISFPEGSRTYLVETLRSIDKGPKDIIIAAAHSRTGYWIDQLSSGQRALVMEKCDLVLSATTHFWGRKIVPGWEGKGPLLLNTGSITYPSRWSPHGWVQVHILGKPLSLVVQYINADRPEREMQSSDYAFIKVVGGKTLETKFRKPRPEEKVDRIVGYLPRDFSKEEMDRIVRELYLELTHADEAYISAGSRMERGKVTWRLLWDVFPYNNEIYSLTLKAKEVRSIFGAKLPMRGRGEIKLAISSYHGDYLIRKLKLPRERIVKTGINEIPLLEEWVTRQGRGRQ